MKPVIKLNGEPLVNGVTGKPILQIEAGDYMVFKKYKNKRYTKWYNKDGTQPKV